MDIYEYKDHLIKHKDESIKNIQKLKSVESTIIKKANVFLMIERILGWHYKIEHIYATELLYQNNVINMDTGEGKTGVGIAATLFNYLFTELQTIVIVPNTYLAQRDFNILNKIINSIGIESGLILDSTPWHKKKLYYEQFRIIYTTASILCFDYLKNFFCTNKINFIDYKFEKIILDEVDNILIDEATHPLIMNHNSCEDINFDLELLQIANKWVQKNMIEDIHYRIYKDALIIQEAGYDKISLVIRNWNIEAKYIINVIINAIIANSRLYIKNIQYILSDNRIISIDKHSGRKKELSRLSNGLQEALEVKENLITSKTIDKSISTSYQSFFNQFKYLSGMSGSVKPNRIEIESIYNTKVYIVPRINLNLRKKLDDVIATNTINQYKLILKTINKYKFNRPIIVFMESVQEVESLSHYLNINNVRHNTLNAKDIINYEKVVIQNAGKKDGILITTNISGRGTDIKLGTQFELHVRDPIYRLKRYYKLLEQMHIINHGGPLLICCYFPLDYRTESQIMGRVARQGEPGETINIYNLESEIFKQMNNYSSIQYLINSKKEKLSNSLTLNVIQSLNQLRNDYVNHMYEMRLSTYKIGAIRQYHLNKFSTLHKLLINMNADPDYIKKLNTSLNFKNDFKNIFKSYRFIKMTLSTLYIIDLYGLFTDLLQYYDVQSRIIQFESRLFKYLNKNDYYVMTWKLNDLYDELFDQLIYYTRNGIEDYYKRFKNSIL